MGVGIVTSMVMVRVIPTLQDTAISIIEEIEEDDTISDPGLVEGDGTEEVILIGTIEGATWIWTTEDQDLDLDFGINLEGRQWVQVLVQEGPIISNINLGKIIEWITMGNSVTVLDLVVMLEEDLHHHLREWAISIIIECKHTMEDPHRRHLIAVDEWWIKILDSQTFKHQDKLDLLLIKTHPLITISSNIFNNSRMYQMG
jgi:hypothetical protein